VPCAVNYISTLKIHNNHRRFTVTEIRALSIDDLCVLLGITKTNRKLDVIIPSSISLIGTIIGWLLGQNFFSEVTMIISSNILFLGMYGAWGFRIVPSQNEWIIEEFGRYKRTLRAGWNFLCLPGIIDIIANDKITTKRQNLQIVAQNKKAVEVDFNCGASAPVTIEVWYQITSSFLWHYRVSSPSQWFHDQVSAFLQPILERRTLDQARGTKRRIAQLYRKKEDLGGGNDEKEIHFIDSDEYARDLKFHEEEKKKKSHYNEPEPDPNDQKYQISFKQYVENRIGVEWTDLLISDIQIPDEIQKVRKIELEASTDRRARKEKAIGYVDAIVAIKNAASEAGINLSDEQAIEIYNQNKDREAFQGSGANVTIVSSDVRNAIASLFPNSK
jgi:regulator of protease activity HflC (stomatin/prohibitin superfamily)